VDVGLAQLIHKRNRGWPWPEDSWGLTPMYGPDGWCKGCGVPLHQQTGSLVLQRRNLTSAGAWVPNWQHDIVCLETTLADEVERRFDVVLRDVVAPRGELCGRQILTPTVGERWFDPAELSAAAVARHGSAGARCDTCGTWRWMPLGADDFGPTGWRLPQRVRSMDVAASPEWFGDGWKCFREVVFSTELAEFIAAASPQDFSARPIDLAD
jgi:hypothetical protein